MRFNQPTLGVLEALPRFKQAEKVWKHFFSPTEGWSALAPPIPAVLLAGLSRAGCGDPSSLAPAHIWSPGCDGALRAVHDEVWRGAYAELLAAPETQCARSARDGRWIMLAPRGVYAVASTEEPPTLVTVYRPHPRGLNVDVREEDFVFFAAQRWVRETRMPVQSLITELDRRVVEPVAVWRVARAVAEAQAQSDEAIVDAASQAAAWLGGLPPALTSAALPSPARLLDLLQAALGDEDCDVEVLLGDLEDAVLVTAALRGVDEADRLSGALGAVLDWCPPSWGVAAPFVLQRIESGPAWARSFWRQVDEAIGAAALQASPPVHRPEATLTAKLLAPPWWRSMLERLASLGGDAVRLLSGTEAGWVAGPARMGSANHSWDVRAPTEVLPAGTRVFAVHAGCPEGEELTGELRAGEPIWELEAPGEELRLVLVRGGTGAGLPELLRSPLPEARLTVTVVEISRPR
jgi:hypothetical protein